MSAPSHLVWITHKLNKSQHQRQCGERCSQMNVLLWITYMKSAFTKINTRSWSHFRWELQGPIFFLNSSVHFCLSSTQKRFFKSSQEQTFGELAHHKSSQSDSQIHTEQQFSGVALTVYSVEWHFERKQATCIAATLNVPTCMALNNTSSTDVVILQRVAGDTPAQEWSKKKYCNKYIAKKRMLETISRLSANHSFCLWFESPLITSIDFDRSIGGCYLPVRGAPK